ncbi:MAG: hypothetical protein HIU91_12895 [Acidobacteria bacterium]|nr:hypothetical protein [Acidobacteriota bacterium]
MLSDKTLAQASAVREVFRGLQMPGDWMRRPQMLADVAKVEEAAGTIVSVVDEITTDGKQTF